MRRLIVTPEADADASEILGYLHREAGARVAESYNLRFQDTKNAWLTCRRAALLDRRSAATHASRSCNPTCLSMITRVVTKP
jgi:plasmid stabilization system protein ParE